MPLQVIASFFGWSTGTTVHIGRQYGHVGRIAQEDAVSVLDAATWDSQTTDVGKARDSERETAA